MNEVCIRYADVNGAIILAKRMKNYRRPHGLNSLEPSVEAIETTAELVLQVTKILAKQLSNF